MKKIKGKQIETVDSTQVILTKDLKITKNVGEVTIPTGQTYATINSTGKTVQEVLEEILSKDNEPTVTNPAVSSALPNLGYKESGSSFTYSVTPTLNPGSYQYGPATGVIAKIDGATLIVGDTTKTGAVGTSLDIPCVANTDCNPTTGTNVSAKLRIAYNASPNVPKTQLGNNSTKTAKIAEGQTTDVSVTAFTSYLPVFYGTCEAEKNDDITSAMIRACSKSDKPVGSIKNSVLKPVGAASNANSIAANSEHKCYIIAIPTGATYSGFTAQDMSTFYFYEDKFVKQVMNVNDAGGNAHSYDVYIYRNALNTTEQKFNIIIS